MIVCGTYFAWKTKKKENPKTYPNTKFLPISMDGSTKYLRKKTRITGFCASSTEGSDHCLRKNSNIFQIFVVFFQRGVINGAETGDYVYSTAIVK